MAEYVGHYISLAKLENRMGASVVKRIYDDRNVGVVDPENGGPLAQVIRDAESMFEGACRGKYVIAEVRAAALLAESSGEPHEPERICLDLAEALACKRFPRAAQRDWQPLMMDAKGNLSAVRRGEMRFDVEGSPEPTAAVGGEVFNGTESDPIDPFEPTFLNGFGSY